MAPNTTYLGSRWRVGRKVPRHIYVQLGDEPSNGDPEIAVAVGAEGLAEVIAYTIVEEHNESLERKRTREGWSGLEPH